ncbi:MAG: hypothetical protein IPM69_05590 [Ignavibacteria bacterium]|nr:hypothetical protein [Ignavibacteria bacterium]
MQLLDTKFWYILFLLLTHLTGSLSDAHAQYKWNLLTTPTQKIAMNAIAVSASGKYVVAVGQFTCILESNNNGASFFEQSFGSVGDLLSATFFSQEGVLAVDDNGHVYRRSASGGIWTKRSINPGNSFYTIEYCGANIILIGSGNGAIFRSTDAGTTWNKVTSLSSTIYSIASSKTGTCIAVGANGMIAHSTDNGLTWQHTPMQADNNKTLRRISFVSDSTWIIAGDTSYLARTTDNGTTWSQISLDPTITQKVFYPLALAFNTNKHGLLIGWNNYLATAFIYSTSDGGATWQTGENILGDPASQLLYVTDVKFPDSSLRSMSSGNSTRISSIRLIPDSLPYLYERREIISRYMTGAENSPVEYSPASASSFFSLYREGKSRFIGGIPHQFNVLEERSQEGAILKRWHEDARYDSTFMTNLSFESATYLSENNALILADSSAADGTYIYKRLISTTNGGATWKSITPDTNLRLSNPVAKSSTEFMVQSGTSLIYHTTTGGESWTKLTLPFSPTNLSLATTSQSFLAFATKADNSTTLLRFADGNQWEVLLASIPSGKRIFLSQHTIVIIGIDSAYTLIIAPDERTATLSTLGASKDKFAPNFSMVQAYQNKIFEAGRNFIIKVSSDTGQTLRNVIADKSLTYLQNTSSPTDKPVGMFMLGSRLYLGMYYGTIIYSDLKDTISTSVEFTTTSPLPSPYPNPSSVSTTLKIPRSLVAGNSALSLKIYSPVGVEIADLTEQLTMQDECITATLRTAEFAPGVYNAVWGGGGNVNVQTIVVVR